VQDMGQTFDLVICSEVLEHVAAYDAFFPALAAVTSPSGLLIVTVPNGYGPKELECKFVRFLDRWQLFSRLRAVKNRLVGRSDELSPQGQWGTLNRDSGHVNFFARSDILRLYNDSGFGQVRMVSRRVWGGGPISSFVINRSQLLIRLNVGLASSVPWFLTSSWAFWGRKVRSHADQGSSARRG